MNVLNISDIDKMLIIAPHPDDECIGAGGILCQYPDQCDVVVLTDGAQGQGNLLPEECRCIRFEEFQSEMRSLGIEAYQMFNLPDGLLMQYLDCLENYNLSKYSKIFVTGSKDNHADHTAAYLCLIHALKFQHIQDVDVYLYEVHNPLEHPTHYLDITNYINQKAKLIQKHRSQLVTVPYDRYACIAAEYRALQNRMNGHFIEVYSLVGTDVEVDQQKLNLENDLQKFKQFYGVLTKWLLSDNPGKLANFLYEMGIHHCAIYGYSELGRILRKKLAGSQVDVSYVLDKKKCHDPEGNLKFYYPGNEPIKAEAVIVTAIYYFEEIKQELEKNGYKNIISLKDMIDRI